MNKQRKVLITTTYNEMGIVIDTKAEEVAQPEILACGEGELNVPDTNVGDTISRQAALDALWKALFKYEDDTEKQFQESDELDLSEWMVHRIFVQNMSDIDRQTILNLPPAQPKCKRGEWIVEDEFIDCSVCRREKWSRIPYEDLVRRFRYCPNCGTGMRGGTMTTTELIKLLKKYEFGGATGRPREVMFQIDDEIVETDNIEVVGA